MNPRLQNYFLACLISLIVFIPFSGNEFIDTIIFAAFLASTLLFLFTKEEKPKAESLMQDPKVHYYQSSRINYYAYGMISISGFLSFIFYFISLNTNIRLAFLLFPLWIILGVSSHYVDKYTAKLIFIV